MNNRQQLLDELTRLYDSNWIERLRCEIQKLVMSESKCNEYMAVDIKSGNCFSILNTSSLRQHLVAPVKIKDDLISMNFQHRSTHENSKKQTHFFSHKDITFYSSKQKWMKTWTLARINLFSKKNSFVHQVFKSLIANQEPIRGIYWDAEQSRGVIDLQRWAAFSGFNRRKTGCRLFDYGFTVKTLKDTLYFTHKLLVGQINILGWTLIEQQCLNTKRKIRAYPLNSPWINQDSVKKINVPQCPPKVQSEDSEPPKQGFLQLTENLNQQINEVYKSNCSFAADIHRIILKCKQLMQYIEKECSAVGTKKRKGSTKKWRF